MIDSLDVFQRNEHQNILRPPPIGPPDGGPPASFISVISASPSCSSPLTTSVTLPSEMPVLIDTGAGPSDCCTQTVRSPGGASLLRRARLISGGGRKRKTAFGTFST